MRKRLTVGLLIGLMPAFGFGVYSYLGTLKSKTIRAPARVPIATKPRFLMPGTLILAQGGALFRLENGIFTPIGTAGGWEQAVVTPDHSKLVAVSRTGLSSDLYLLDLDGHVVKQLTRDQSRVIDGNHWAYYPRLSPDGKVVYYSYDRPKFGYRVDFAVWSLPLDGTQNQARRQTTPNGYTGGDVAPLPLASGGLLYVKYSVGPSGTSSQIWLQSRPGTFGRPLTDSADNCSQPALSPDAGQLAMICSPTPQTTRLVVAPFDGNRLGSARTLFDHGLVASPVWSPDGHGLAYFAPVGASGHFQLWWLPLAPFSPGGASVIAAWGILAGAPVAAQAGITAAWGMPQQVTVEVDLSPTSTPSWY